MSQMRETRFALVLNGGVSLAIWMGGVTHELNRLRLASSGAEPESPAERDVQDVWVKVLQSSNRKVVVDTIAGTSAGGLNGTLLGAAISAGKELPDMRSRWSQLAALEADKLLRAADMPMESILNGKFFADQIVSLLDEIANGAQAAEPSDCTLLVTATAIDATPVPVSLEGGGQATVADSRRVFRFDRRTDDQGDVRDDFSAAPAALDRAARASASFPAAFEPVWETNDLRQFREPTFGQAASSWLIDGGVLDNAPFGPLIKALRERPIGAPFERVILYVTPSPGSNQTSAGLGTRPEIIEVLGRVISAAREPDQRLDFEDLQKAFRQMGYTRASAHDAVTRLLYPLEPTVDVAAATEAAESWFPTYRFSRAEAIEQELSRLNGELRLVGAGSLMLDPGSFISVPEIFELQSDGNWGWGLTTAERLLRWWGRALVDCVARNSDIDATGAFTSLQESQRKIARLFRGLHEYLDTDPHQSISELAGRLNDFLETVDADLRRTISGTAQAIANVGLEGGIDAQSLLNFTLAVEVISSVMAWSETSDGDALRFRYQQVTPAARSIVDIGEVGSDEDWLNRKLYGERLGHFGAFLSEDSRKADWLWGRLDGASTLCDYLLGPGPGTQALRAELADAILAAEGTSRDGLRQAAAEANDAREPTALLKRIDVDARRLIVTTIWRRVVDLVGTPDPTDGKQLGPAQLARAFADPTWTHRELPDEASVSARLKARLVRAYGAPLRWFARRRVKKSLGI